jgi:hypothetical protein
VAVLFFRRDAANSFVIIWALAAIGVKHSDNQTIVMTAAVGFVLIAVTLIGVLVLVRFRKK